MIKPAFLLLPALILACEEKEESFDSDTTPSAEGWDPPGDDDDDDGGDTAYPTDDFCSVSVREVYPEDGSVDAYYRGIVEFELSELDPTARIELLDASGAEIPGEQAFDQDRDTVIFTPDQPLEPSAEYTAELTWCEGSESLTTGFRTSDLGEPLTADVTGNTYLFEVNAGRVVAPPGVGDLLFGLVEQPNLLGVVSAGSELELRGAIATVKPEEQDTCAPTGEGLVGDFDQSPYFAIDAGTVAVHFAEFPAVLGGVTLSGAFAPDGQSIGGLEIRGELDARDLGPLLEDQLEDTSPEYVCDLLVGFGIACEPCATDAQPYCADFHVLDLTAIAQDIALEPILATDCHEACEASCANAECPEAADFAACL